MALVAPLELVSGQIFNTGSSFMNFTLRQLADLIGRMEPDLAVEYIDNEDLRNYRVSFERIRRELGFQCHTSLETGVRGLQDALRRGLVKDYREPVYSNYQTLLAQVRRPQEQPAPFAGLTAPKFSRNSLWWSMNGTNSQAPATNGIHVAAANGSHAPANGTHAANGSSVPLNGHSAAPAVTPAPLLTRVAAAGA
jgi:hypothetical protein